MTPSHTDADEIIGPTEDFLEAQAAGDEMLKRRDLTILVGVAKKRQYETDLLLPGDRHAPPLWSTRLLARVGVPEHGVDVAISEAEATVVTGVHNGEVLAFLKKRLDAALGSGIGVVDAEIYVGLLGRLNVGRDPPAPGRPGDRRRQGKRKVVERRLRVFKAEVVVDGERQELTDADTKLSVGHVLLIVKVEQRRIEFTES